MDKEIIELYNSGLSIMEIHKQTNISRPKISKILKENNIKIRNKIPDKDFYDAYEIFKENNSLAKTAKAVNISKSTLRVNFKRLNLRDYERDSSYDNDIIELYNENKTEREIANILSISFKKVQDCLRYHNLNRKRTCKKHYDKNIFKIIDTEEKAYWLGFLYADGYVDINKGIELSLKADDLEHIKKFKTFMKSNHKISYRKNVNAYRISITSQELAQDLTNLGCHQAKSLTLKFPTKEQVPEHLIHHFMRGYFDGDGCICISSEQPIFIVTGTSNFLDKYEKIILNVLNKNKPNKRYNDGKAYNIRYGGNKQCKKIFDFLYENATVYLKRKYDKFNNKELPSQDEAINNPGMIRAELSENDVTSKDSLFESEGDQ